MNIIFFPDKYTIILKKRTYLESLFEFFYGIKDRFTHNMKRVLLWCRSNEIINYIICMVLSLEFSESPDRRGMNLVARTCKNKPCTGSGMSAASLMFKLE